MSVRSLLLYSSCSYDGDVDIDALVKEPITAGVKGLKVGTSPFYYSLLFPSSSSSSSSYVFTSGVKTVLYLPAQGNDQDNFGATYWWSTAGGRSHPFLHSTARECPDYIFHDLTALVPNQRGRKPTIGSSRLHRGVAMAQKEYTGGLYVTFIKYNCYLSLGYHLRIAKIKKRKDQYGLFSQTSLFSSASSQHL